MGQRRQLRRAMGCREVRLASGETALLLLHSLSIRIGTPTKGRGGCSRVTVSPMARFDGHGAKLYSRGGGYEGNWVEGRRVGQGAHIFAGKYGALPRISKSAYQLVHAMKLVC